MLGLGGAMLDIVPGAGILEGMRPEDLSVGDGLFDEGHADPPAPGVVHCMPLSVSTVWIL